MSLIDQSTEDSKIEIKKGHWETVSPTCPCLRNRLFI